jgi:hypothetical protein
MIPFNKKHLDQRFPQHAKILRIRQNLLPLLGRHGACGAISSVNLDRTNFAIPLTLDVTIMAKMRDVNPCILSSIKNGLSLLKGDFLSIYSQF